MTKQHKSDLALLLITVGWGASFLLTQNSISTLPAYQFLALRFLLAFAISAMIFRKKMLQLDAQTVLYGFGVGTMLFASYALQTIGLEYTTIPKSAFITGFSVVLTPLLSMALSRKMPEPKAFVCILLAFAGLGLLTLTDSIHGINFGDFLTLLCAITCAIHILLSGKYTKKVDSISFAIVQIGVVGLWSTVFSALLEKPVFHFQATIWINITILSLLCTAGAFIIQMIAQNHTTPEHTALIYTAEPVFASLFGYIFNGTVLGPKGTFGAFLILAGMLLSELKVPPLSRRKPVN